MADFNPFSTPGTYSRGTAPPTTLFSKMKPAPRLPGAMVSLIRANCPAPPVCLR